MFRFQVPPGGLHSLVQQSVEDLALALQINYLVVVPLRTRTRHRPGCEHRRYASTLRPWSNMMRKSALRGANDRRAKRHGWKRNRSHGSYCSLCRVRVCLSLSLSKRCMICRGREGVQDWRECEMTTAELSA
jgi:hypothetical protein